MHTDRVERFTLDMYVDSTERILIKAKAMAAGMMVSNYLRKLAGMKPRRVSEHGKLSMYVHSKCRCEPCRAANTNYAAQRAAAKKAAQ